MNSPFSESTSGPTIAPAATPSWLDAQKPVFLWNIQEDVDRTLVRDPILSDVFIFDRGGGISINPKSRILAGHFPGLPIVPGVVLKRLFRDISHINPYEKVHASSEKETDWGWQTFFNTAVTPNIGKISLHLGQDTIILTTEDDRTVTTFKKASPEFENGEYLNDIDFPGVFDRMVQSIEWSPIKKEVDHRILQSGIFRFVTAGVALSEFASGDRFWGYFDFPKSFPFIQKTGAREGIPCEILEESVAQISSLAYAKMQGFDPVKKSDGSIDAKAKILTFGSSISHSEKALVVPGERLLVIGERVSETKRSVVMRYKAFNKDYEPVLQGWIEGSVVPLALLQRATR